jgi:hypothetical protein
LDCYVRWTFCIKYENQIIMTFDGWLASNSNFSLAITKTIQLNVKCKCMF